MRNRSIFLYLALMAVFIVTTAATINGQNHRTSASPADISKLRVDFIAATSADLELVKDEVVTGPKEIGGLNYWLAWVRPKRAGRFTLTYTVNFRDGSYVRGERIYELRVGEPGCRRSVMPYISAGNYCLGDMVILPIRLQGYLNHKFAIKEQTEKSLPKIDPTGRVRQALNRVQPLPESVYNPLTGNLKFLGTSRYESLRADLSVVVGYAVVFEADRPGRFNLSVGADPGGNASDPEASEANQLAIIVVDPSTPVTFLAAQENTIDYTRDPRVTVSNSNNYQTGTLILQSGDTISIPYASRYYSAKAARPGKPIEDDSTAQTLRPMILRREFKPKMDSYDAWILDYLPR